MNELNRLKDAEIISKIESLEGFGYSRSFCALVYVHYVTACRISDLLSLTGSNFSSNYVVTVNQSKQSYQLVHYIALYHDIIDIWRQSTGRIAGTYSRQSIYRIYKKVGLTLGRGAGNRDSVTHNFRVRRAHDVFLQDENIASVTRALGHKSKRSAQYYIRDLKPHENIQRGALSSPTNTNDVIIINRKGIVRIS